MKANVKAQDHDRAKEVKGDIWQGALQPVEGQGGGILQQQTIRRRENPEGDQRVERQSYAQQPSGPAGHLADELQSGRRRNNLRQNGAEEVAPGQLRTEDACSSMQVGRLQARVLQLGAQQSSFRQVRLNQARSA